MDNNKKLFEELLKADGINPAGASESERIAFAKILDRQLKTKQSHPASGPNVWRVFMKSKITKSAAAAILFAATLFLMQSILAPRAFAIEKTVQAIGILKTLHVAGIYLDETGKMSKVEIWARPHPEDKARSGDFWEEIKGKQISVVSEKENTTWRYYPEKNQVQILTGIQNTVKPFWPDGNFFMELKKNASQWQETFGKDGNGNDCVIVTCSYVLDRLPDRKFDFWFQFDAQTMLPVNMKLHDLSTTRGVREYQFDVIELNKPVPENIFVFDMPEGAEIMDNR